MKVVETMIDGLKVIYPDRYKDERGYFCETYSKKELALQGVHYEFVQDNESVSRAGVIRGLHYQDFPEGQVKLVRCVMGTIMDVAVDVRKGSPTFGKVFTIELSDENGMMLLIPKGFLHGFAALTDVLVNYKCSWYYEKNLEKGIAYNDPTLNILWPVENPTLSDKDLQNPKFIDVFGEFI